MGLRNLELVSYIPLLGLRPAELQALKELPVADKQMMMPLLQIGPWATANYLHSAISKLEEAYSDFPCFVSIADVEMSTTERPVHLQLAELRDGTNGYDAWCRFIESKSQFVPTVQLSDPNEIPAQAIRLHGLGRGLMVLMERRGFPGIDALAQTIARYTNGGVDVCFMLDFGRGTRHILTMTLEFQGFVTQIRQHAPSAYVTISSSSFPEAFTSIEGQEIYERTLFNTIRSNVGGRLIYSDRGSARAERQAGGGGTPAPRVDYATGGNWSFYRSDEENADRFVAYANQARRAMESTEWDSSLRIWGTQMIERTALGDMSAIVSPKRSTAARINIHLHRQTFYGDNSGLYDTDDVWND